MQYCNALLRCIWKIGGEMNNIGSMGISTVSVLTSLLLVGAGTSSFMFEGSDDLANDAEKIVNEAMKEITTYIKIDDILGKYYTNNGVQKVERIVILVKQFIESTIDFSEVTIKLSNKEDVAILTYSGHADKSGSDPIFENQVWENTDNAFSLIVIIDKDKSLLDYGIMNEDTAFIAIRLPARFAMKDDKSITVSLIPSQGITRSIVLETPSFHTSNVISFEEV